MFNKKEEAQSGSDEPERSGGDAGLHLPGWSHAVARDSSGKPAPSIIGEDLTITGNVISKGDIQVDGEIQGDVQCGSLLLGDKSQIIGGAAAEDVLVRGRVVGSIKGLRVTLQAQSHVEGDIYHASLAIEQGAYFEGKSRRCEDPLSISPDKTAGATDRPGSGSDRGPRIEPRVTKGVEQPTGQPAQGAGPRTDARITKP
jgi:cytoskeletal protein CcmA (bactofilin family)